ncbi:MAG: ketopantoate reductase family protein, partial [Janthinobacterium lividum]
MHDIVIVGAGAMGCLFAARLAESGAAATLVDIDRARLDALDRDGVTLEDDSGTRTVAIAARTAGELSIAPDLILLFTKGLHSIAAIRSVAHLAGPDTYALTLQNGIGNVEALTEVFAADRILMGVTDYPSNLEGPTRVSSHGDGRVHLGSYEPRSSATAAAEVASLLNRAGLNADVSAAIGVAMWEKVAFNAA